MPSNYGRSANQPELALMHEVEKRQQLHPYSRPNAASLIPTKINFSIVKKPHASSRMPVGCKNRRVVMCREINVALLETLEKKNIGQSIAEEGNMCV
ncbi:uncharacterized protein RSE6_13261 [Rhynchosporium secalis]|uniref:Uncharacterized protein n=1 Tax=Rhynchosporium secalis TaxID=38038 RepID=A0A1E1MTA6_RHYSE|nr:uncharacterized protein RSE6_13261 [Rhynchosporium secalis]